MRTYPVPAASNTLHAMSDLHCDPGFSFERRRDFVVADVGYPSVPDVNYRVVTGDFANTADVDEYAAGKAFMNSMPGHWYSAIGNHDMWTPGDGTGLQPHRQASAAAADLGMPTSSFTVDMGFAVLVVPHPVDSTLRYDPSWINTALQANASKHCVIAAHGSLKNTAGVGEDTGTQVRTSENGWFASGLVWGTTTDLDTCLADNPNAKAWVGGHTHSPLNTNQLVTGVTYGSHTIAAVNATAISYQGLTVEWWERLTSVFMTFEEDRIDVRFRNHGAHAWAGGSKEFQRCWTVTL